MNKIFAALLCLVFSSGCFALSVDQNQEKNIRERMGKLSTSDKKKLDGARSYYKKLVNDGVMLDGISGGDEMPAVKVMAVMSCLELNGTVSVQLQRSYFRYKHEQIIEIGCSGMQQ